MHGLRFSSWLEWRGWHLAGSASCARFSDGRVHGAESNPAKRAETHRKSREMSYARSRGMTERRPVELTVCMAFFVRAKHRGLVKNHPWCLSRVSLGIRDRNGSRPCIFFSWAEFLSEFSAIVRACLSTLYSVVFLQPQSHLSAWILAVAHSSKPSSGSHDIFSFHCTVVFSVCVSAAFIMF